MFHYLDDFALVGPPGSGICKRDLLVLKRVCRELGVPLAAEKEEGPSTRLTLLGITIDTVQGSLSLPEEKLSSLQQSLAEWESKKVCNKRELESLIGTLQHAATVIRPGRTFLRRAIALLNGVKYRHHHIRLNVEFRSDIAWWRVLASHWNGTSVFIDGSRDSTTFTSDSSGNWGCGAWHGNKWFQLEWDHRAAKLHIAAKELIPIIIGAVIWGQEWQGKNVKVWCDNTAVVACLKTRYSKDSTLMQLLRCLFFVEAFLQFRLRAFHIAGANNELADALSRNEMGIFHHLNSDADPYPSPIPSSLLQLLLDTSLDWTSPAWTRQFNSTVLRE